MLIIWIVSPVFIADFLSALAMISCKGLSFLCWSWRDFLFLSMPTQHASWLLGKLNLYQLLFIVMLQLAVGIACMHQRVQLLTQLHWSLEGLGHVNLWPEELERKRMGKSSRWTLIWSLLRLFLVDWKLLLVDWASALSPHSSLIGHSCGTSLFARKWTCRCCLWVVVCTLG